MKKFIISVLVGIFIAALCLGVVVAAIVLFPKPAPSPKPQYQPGDFVQLILGGRPAQVLRVDCFRDGCRYNLRVFEVKALPSKMDWVREFEIRPVEAMRRR